MGRSRGGLTTKIHALVETLGNPIAHTITRGQTHDLVPALDLLAQANPQAVIADKAFDADTLIDPLVSAGMEPVIPSKSNRKPPVPAITCSTKSATSWNASSTSPSTPGASRPATTSSPDPSWQASTSPQPPSSTDDTT